MSLRITLNLQHEQVNGFDACVRDYIGFNGIIYSYRSVFRGIVLRIYIRRICDILPLNRDISAQTKRRETMAYNIGHCRVNIDSFIFCIIYSWCISSVKFNNKLNHERSCVLILRIPPALELLDELVKFANKRNELAKNPGSPASKEKLDLLEKPIREKIDGSKKLANNSARNGI
jgi:hypothetical protein